jgi:hypothetical protein
MMLELPRPPWAEHERRLNAPLALDGLAMVFESEPMAIRRVPPLDPGRTLSEVGPRSSGDRASVS